MPAPTIINLNNDTPAPPNGGQNVLWQADNNNPRNVSAYIPSTGGAEEKTANYDIQASDCGMLIVGNTNGSPPLDFTFYLPSSIPGEGSPPVTFTQWCVFVQNIGPGVLALNPNGLELDGSTSPITLSEGQGIYIATDGVNYFSERGMGGGGSSLLLETNGTANTDQSLLNLNGTTPAAPSGKTNVSWQTDSSGDVSAYMPLMVGDSGSGGTSGAVPAPPAGSAAAGKFLNAGGSFSVPSGGAGGGGMWKLSLPAFSAFTWMNQGGASDTAGTNFLAITAPSSGSTEWRCLVQAVPGSTPWRLFALVMLNEVPGVQQEAGILVTDGTKLITLSYNSNTGKLSVDKWTTTSAFSANSFTSNVFYPFGILWFQIYNDGTNLHFLWSIDGVWFFDTGVSIGISSFLSSVVSYGFGADDEASKGCSIACLSFANAMTAQ
jgi:hypothetical protein